MVQDARVIIVQKTVTESFVEKVAIHLNVLLIVLENLVESTVSAILAALNAKERIADKDAKVNLALINVGQKIADKDVLEIFAHYIAMGKSVHLFA